MSNYKKTSPLTFYFSKGKCILTLQIYFYPSFLIETIIPIIITSLIFVESDQVSLTRPIYIEKLQFVTETSGLNSEGGLIFEWS